MPLVGAFFLRIRQPEFDIFPEKTGLSNACG
jgi:hypothetical protein